MTGKDWRDDLALAVAYRMHAIDNETSVEEAGRRIRHLMKHGPGSPYATEVMRAAFELFGSSLQPFGPVLQIVFTMLKEVVEREIENGRGIAALIEPTS